MKSAEKEKLPDETEIDRSCTKEVIKAVLERLVASSKETDSKDTGRDTAYFIRKERILIHVSFSSTFGTFSVHDMSINFTGKDSPPWKGIRGIDTATDHIYRLTRTFLPRNHNGKSNRPHRT